MDFGEDERVRVPGNICIDIAEGEIIDVIGKSGCGKTVLTTPDSSAAPTIQTTSNAGITASQLLNLYKLVID